MRGNNAAFRLEEERSMLAHAKNLKKLKSTYIKESPEIADKNTSAMWSKLNLHQITSEENPMAWDRVHICAELANSKHAILDIGFGSGIIEKLILKNSPDSHIFGIDIAKGSILVAKREIPEGEFLLGSILKLPYNNSKFDCILALEVMEHIQPHLTFKAFSEVARVLKKGGSFILSVPLNEGLEELVKSNKNLNAHVRIYTPDLIKAELQIAGFTVLSEQYLFAFHSLYKVKSIIARLLPNRYKFNNIILLCRKK